MLCSVLAGQAAVPRGLVGALVEELRDHTARRRTLAAEGDAGVLTSREWEIVDLLRHGLTTREIATRLVLSPVTVRTHVNAAVRKLSAGDRDGLVRRFPVR